MGVSPDEVYDIIERHRVEMTRALNEDINDLRADLLEYIDGSESTDEPSWMAIARGELGVREIPGDRHNPRILEYLDTTNLGLWAKGRDETYWCSCFVNWVLLEDGYEGTDSAWARSWLGYGLELDEPRVGCLVIFSRGPRGGHVGFFVGYAEDGSILTLGGNQDDGVSIKAYPRARLLGYRWPEQPTTE